MCLDTNDYYSLLCSLFQVNKKYLAVIFRDIPTMAPSLQIILDC